MRMQEVGERTQLLGREGRGRGGYGVQGERTLLLGREGKGRGGYGVQGDQENRDKVQSKEVSDYFASIDQSVSENTRQAQKVSDGVLKLFPIMEKHVVNNNKQREEDFSTIAANIIVNFQL